MIDRLAVRGILAGFMGLLAAAAATADPGALAPKTYAGISAVEVDGGPLSVDIQGQDSDVISASEKDLAKGVAVDYAPLQGTLKVTVTVPPGIAGNPGTIELSMPRYEFLTVQNDAGSVSIDNLSTEKLDVTTTAGSITIKDTNAGLNATSTSGSLTFASILGAITALSTAGSIDVDGEAGILSLTTASGTITAKDIALQGPASFADQTGSIAVAFQYGLAGIRFKLSSTTGTLTVGASHGTQSLEVGGGVLVTGSSTTGSQTYQ